MTCVLERQRGKKEGKKGKKSVRVWVGGKKEENLNTFQTFLCLSRPTFQYIQHGGEEMRAQAGRF